MRFDPLRRQFVAPAAFYVCGRTGRAAMRPAYRAPAVEPAPRHPFNDELSGSAALCRRLALAADEWTRQTLLRNASYLDSLLAGAEQ